MGDSTVSNAAIPAPIASSSDVGVCAVWIGSGGDSTAAGSSGAAGDGVGMSLDGAGSVSVAFDGGAVIRFGRGRGGRGACGSVGVRLAAAWRIISIKMTDAGSSDAAE